MPVEVIPKRFCAGTHRACAPSETLRRVRPLLGAMGITRVGNITGLDHIGIPVAIAVRPNARSLAVAAGKGATWPAAQVSALMEAVETHHAEHIELPLARASARELERKRAVVEIETLPQMLGAGVSRDSRLLWLDGYDLMQEETVAVPYEAVSLDFTLPGMAGGGVFAASSNGLASGNHRLEAISHALNEVIERDALALWSAQGADARNRTRVQRASVDDALCRAMLERCERAGVEATIWNITSAVGVAAFRCRLRPRAASGGHWEYAAPGTGCHPARAVALLRALTEAAQVRLVYIAGVRDDLFRDLYARMQDPGWQAREGLDEGEGACAFAEVPDATHADFGAEVAFQLERLRAAGLRRAIAVDLTRVEFAIPVVKMMVPEMEGHPFAAQYVAGARARRVGR